MKSSTFTRTECTSDKRDWKRRLKAKYNVTSGRQWVKLRKRLRRMGRTDA